MTFDEYDKEAGITAVYPGQGTALGLMYVGLKMNGEAGEFAEHVGKAVRDDGLMASQDDVDFHELHPLTDSRRDLLIKEIGDVLWYLSAAAKELGTSLSDVAATNVNKLKSRVQRNVLQGSGDNR